MSAFYGNGAVLDSIMQMIGDQRIPQTILLDGPEGVGKAKLARRFGGRLLGRPELIERDDLSLAENQQIVAEREKLPPEKRNDDPLMFASHPDFVTFAPDGPLRQISIPQMRLLKERAQFKPLHGSHRVFLIDHIDRANETAANSLLKTLEEPPEHLIVFMTAENPYDLLPTIRSRSVQFHLARLSEGEVRTFLEERGADHIDRRVALASGSPGLALSFDLEAYDRRRAAMLALLEAAAGRTGFGAWARHAEAIAASRSEKLDAYLQVLYVLLEDVLLLVEGGPPIRNRDIAAELRALADAVGYEWIRKMVAKTDELVELVARNIQKSIALDAMVVAMRG